MRGKWFLLGSSVVLLSVALGALSLLRKPAPQTAPPPVAVQAPDIVPGAPEISMNGKVEAQKVIAVPAPVGGIIEELLVDTGQDIYEGQILAKIKNGSLEDRQNTAQLDADKAQSKVNNLEAAIVTARLEASRSGADAARAKAQYERTSKEYKRQQMLDREGATARLTFEKARNDFNAAASENDILGQRAKVAEEHIGELIRELDSARKLLEQKNNDLETARSDLQSAVVHSPVDGVLVSRAAEMGGEVKESTEDLFVIAIDLIEMQVVVEPEPALLKQIQPGQAAIIVLAEYGAEVIQGEVKSVSDSSAVITFLSPSPAIKPGLTAQVRIQLSNQPMAAPPQPVASPPASPPKK